MRTTPDKANGELHLALSRMIAEVDPELPARLEQDPESYLDLIGLTHQGAEAMGQLLKSSVTSARLAGVSWERIGRQLDMSRQAAQQRFGTILDAVGSTSFGETRRLTPVTAFNEMGALAEAGRSGWHSIGYGMYFHDLIRSDEQWEHLRVSALGSNQPSLEAEGWQRIGTMWFPWAYYSRPTGKPTETNNAVPPQPSRPQPTPTSRPQAQASGSLNPE